MTEKTAGMFSGHTSNGLVLIVDDEADVRKIVRMTIQKAGYDVIEAEDGAKAIEEINKGEHALTIDTIITDIRMPNVNGVEAIKWFRSQFPSVPIIVMTAYPDLNMATDFLTTGVVDYLVKPVDSEKLTASVAKAIEVRNSNRGEF